MAILQMTVNVGDTREGQWLSEETPIGNWIIDWGDDCIEINSERHQYKHAGIYQITVKGDFTIDHLECPANIISLDKEEGCNIESLNGCFYDCKQLISVPHNWDISKVYSMYNMFRNCLSFNQDLSHWNISRIYDTCNMFSFSAVEEKHKPLDT